MRFSAGVQQHQDPALGVGGADEIAGPQRLGLQVAPPPQEGQCLALRLGDQGLFLHQPQGRRADFPQVVVEAFEGFRRCCRTR